MIEMIDVSSFNFWILLGVVGIGLGGAIMAWALSSRDG